MSGSRCEHLMQPESPSPKPESGLEVAWLQNQSQVTLGNNLFIFFRSFCLQYQLDSLANKCVAHSVGYKLLLAMIRKPSLETTYLETEMNHFLWVPPSHCGFVKPVDKWSFISLMYQ